MRRAWSRRSLIAIACVGFPVARSSVVALDAFTLRKGKTRAHRRVLLREGNGLTALP